MSVFWTILLRTVFIYFAVFCMLRVMGKREIGKLSVFDLVISIMIAEIAVLVIEDVKKPVWEGLLPMIVLVGVQLLLAYVMLKSLWLRRFFDGKPSYIIKRGKIDRKEMSRQRYNLSDLMLQLRQNNVTDVAEVEFAILETTGKLTVVRKSEFRQSNADKRPDSGDGIGRYGTLELEASAELGDDMMMTQISYSGLPLPLIMDGKVQDEALEEIGKDRFWLKNQMQVKGIKEFKEVFLCTIDHRGRLFIDRVHK